MLRFLLPLAIALMATAPRAEIIPVDAATLEALTDRGREAHKAGRHREAMAHHRVAEDLGSLPAHANIGLLYFYGLGVMKDQKRGLTMLEAAAKNGTPRIAYVLARAIERTALRATETGPRWMLKAAEGGDIWAMAHISGLSGRSRAEGPDSEICPQPHRVKFSKRAIAIAEAGDPEAAVAVGRAHRFGFCVEKSKAEAERFFRMAADSGLGTGRYELARLLLHSKGRGAEAVQLFEAMIEDGDDRALAELAVAYRGNQAIERDPQKAVELLLRALRAGQGWMRMQGRTGVWQDFSGQIVQQLVSEGLMEGPMDRGLDREVRRALAVYPRHRREFDFMSVEEDFGSERLRLPVEALRQSFKRADAMRNYVREAVLYDDGSGRTILPAWALAKRDGTQHTLSYSLIAAGREFIGLPPEDYEWIEALGKK